MLEIASIIVISFLLILLGLSWIFPLFRRDKMYLYPYAEKIVHDFLSTNDFVVEPKGVTHSFSYIHNFKFEQMKENCVLADLNIFAGQNIIDGFRDRVLIHKSDEKYSIPNVVGTVDDITFGKFSNKFNADTIYKDIMLLVNTKTAKFKVIKFLEN